MKKEKIYKMIELKHQRLSNQDIAKKIGYSTSSVSFYLRENMKDYKKYKIRNGRVKLSKKTINKMIRLKKQGLSNNKIAEIIGSSRTTVRRYLLENMKNYKKYRQPTRDGLSEQEISTLIDLKHQKLSNIKIAEKVGYSISTVSKYLNKYMEDYSEYAHHISSKPMSKEKINKIIQLRKKGKTLDEIARIIKSATVTISKYLNLHLPYNDVIVYLIRSKVNKEYIPVICAMIDGKSNKDIINNFNISLDIIKEIRHRYYLRISKKVNDFCLSNPNRFKKVKDRSKIIEKLMYIPLKEKLNSVIQKYNLRVLDIEKLNRLIQNISKKMTMAGRRKRVIIGFILRISSDLLLQDCCEYSKTTACSIRNLIHTYQIEPSTYNLISKK